MQDIQVQFDEPIQVIFCDNTSAISISKNPMMHSKQRKLWSNIILLESRLAKRISSLNMAQMKKLLTSLLDNYLVKNLSIFSKILGFSQVLIRIFLLSNQVESESGGVYMSATWYFFKGSYPLPFMKMGIEGNRKKFLDNRGSTFVAFNAKGGDCWSMGVIDVNPRNTRGYPNLAWEF